ncbi:hypothetical protein L3Q67_35405 [Saccharothrix sp. AJ9571]|nr:hypothetical protein L3Q67_35405 [Saccharothrix sp. AJ9571]
MTGARPRRPVPETGDVEEEGAGPSAAGVDGVQQVTEGAEPGNEHDRRYVPVR